MITVLATFANGLVFGKESAGELPLDFPLVASSHGGIQGPGVGTGSARCDTECAQFEQIQWE
jgi:hypothetical protein